ncbi:MAG: ATP-binding cassette domain-containing protein, partial [Clostridia bacterium]|nr:ATP-binding cassette domain-containing protein [Clostridia bacterium]
STVKASLKRISEVVGAKINVKDADGAHEVADVKGDIEFRNLTFTYPGSEREVLKDVSFKINAGESVGIFGKTGSGKTTIVDLILRVYNVPDGTVFIDGQDVNKIGIKSLRRFAAYVPQDNFLFSDTIENNIGFASDNVDDNLVADVAKLSDVHNNIVEFKDGYKTVLGERGVTVSGGQKQRISIARALMKNAPVLIMDDSVSAVDISTEKIILGNLRKYRTGKTTILIGHRVSTITQMDKIIFIDDGKVADVGTHEELYQRNAEYKRSVDLQKLEDEHREVQNA